MEPVEYEFAERAVRDIIGKKLRPSFPILYYSETLNIHSDHSLLPHAPRGEDFSHDYTAFEKLAKNKGLLEKLLLSAVVRGSIELGVSTFNFFSPTVLGGCFHGADFYTTVNFANDIICPSVKLASKIYTAQNTTDKALRAEMDKLDELPDSDPYLNTRRRDWTKHDIAFLIADEYVASEYFLPYPDVDKLQPGTPLILLSYPGEPTNEWLKKVYRKGEEPTENEMKVAFGCYWDTKSASPGCLLASNTKILCHNCSATHGSSGGVLVLAENPRLAVGIHVSGFPDVNYNMAVSVRNPGFVVQYAKHVVPSFGSSVPNEVDAFLEKHKDTLAKYDSIIKRQTKF